MLGAFTPAVPRLLSLLAQTGAQRHWRSMRCDDPAQAAGVLAWIFIRRWGLTALRENARLKLDRLEFVGRGAAAAALRRANALEAQQAGLRAAAGCLRSGPRARAWRQRAL